ncbi:MAG: radical SAM protein [Oscillospiraceae bacterium]|nr:radical SAM protein [Oscillospiraceae bacterium]
MRPENPRYSKYFKHANISIFVPHAGCPYHCAFCNQHVITEQDKLPHAEQVQEICQQALQSMDETARKYTEIAFFGGSFTAIPRDYMTELLESAQKFIGDQKFSGIRISTRPDCIDPEILKLLKFYHVTSIELGAQSMSDRVLSANHRGHTAQDVFTASGLIREFNFELGLQMMLGLYQSTWDDETETVRQMINIHPDTVRIYPIVILKHTMLGDLYQSGEFQLFCDPEKNSLDDVITMTANYITEFRKHGIRLIKIGLHASEFVEKDMLSGYYHPAFRELCESRIYRVQMEHFLKSGQELAVRVNPKCISKAIGQKRENIRYFQETHGITLKIIPDPTIAIFDIKI